MEAGPGDGRSGASGQPDAVRITVPPLARETMQRFLALIREDVAEERIRIDNPTQNLESTSSTSGQARQGARKLPAPLRWPRGRLSPRWCDERPAAEGFSNGSPARRREEPSQRPRPNRRSIRPGEGVVQPMEPTSASPLPALAPEKRSRRIWRKPRKLSSLLNKSKSSNESAHQIWEIALFPLRPDCWPGSASCRRCRALVGQRIWAVTALTLEGRVSVPAVLGIGRLLLGSVVVLRCF